MDHIRHALLEKHNADILAGRPSDFDSSKQWDAVWGAAIEDRDFWEQEYLVPAAQVVNKLRSLSSVVKGDAPVAASNNGHYFAASSDIYDDTQMGTPSFQRGTAPNT